jgi:hypothetical protein
MDFFNATAEQLEAAGWRRWSKETDLWLCPEKQFAALPDGIALYCISGSVHVKGRDRIDDDTRFGLLAYGIIPGKTRTSVSAIAVATANAARAAEMVEQLASAARTCGVYVVGNDGIEKVEADKAEAVVRGMYPPAPEA